MKYLKIILLLTAATITCPLFAGDFIYTDRQSPVNLDAPSKKDSFTFAILGDRTSASANSLEILQKAVDEINTIGPDMVMTVGDMIQGYNSTDQWVAQANEFKAVMNQLNMPWFPTAGNHDVCWRGNGRPENEHEENYEKHFGPLWYAFQHKNCWFIVLFSDEGDPETGQKDHRREQCQQMSKRQREFLAKTLKRAKFAKHIFVFLHHPRWSVTMQGAQYGKSWDKIHSMLKKAGNVSACFAGHIHKMKYFGNRDGIEYYTMGATGGGLLKNGPRPLEGRLHHFDLVTVRGDSFHISTIPVGSTIDPRSDKVQSLLELQVWSINSEATRTLLYPISIPQFTVGSAMLKIGISGGADDSGDRGVHFELRDTDGKVLASSFSKSTIFAWLDYKVSAGEKFELAIIDNDSALSGRHPGNGGHIVIELEVSDE